ncbi:MAG: TIM barrel protein [Patescibacteria group bacterium]
MALLKSGALWTVRYRGADPFGGPVLNGLSAIEGLNILGEAKIRGIIDLFSAHDDDLVDYDPDDPSDYLNPKSKIHEQIAEIKKAMANYALPMHMITCSLHGHPIFTAGGFTNRNPKIRALAKQKAARCAWIGNELGATMVTYWVARDGLELPITVNPDPGNCPYTWLQEGLNSISQECINKNYSIIGGTIEPKCNEPRGISYLPLVGSAIAFIDRLRHPDFWGVNPEVPQHSSMGNQSPYLEILQAAWMGKLSFLHVGGQIPGQFDNDFPLLVGPGKEEMVHIMYYLDRIGWDGVIEFDCHPLRSDLIANPECQLDIFHQFLSYNSRMLKLLEIVVERLKKNEALQAALTELNSNEYYKPQNHLQVEEAFNMALFNVSFKDLI